MASEFCFHSMSNQQNFSVLTLYFGNFTWPNLKFLSRAIVRFSYNSSLIIFDYMCFVFLVLFFTFVNTCFEIQFNPTTFKNVGYLMLSVQRFEFYYFYSLLLYFQDYFISYETGQSVGGAITGEP